MVNSNNPPHMPHNEENNKVVPQKIYHPRLFIYSAPFLLFSVPLLLTVRPPPNTVKTKRHVMCLRNALRKTPSFYVSAIFSYLLVQNFPNKPKGKQKEERIYLKHLKAHNVHLVVSSLCYLFTSSNASCRKAGDGGLLSLSSGLMSSPFLLMAFRASCSEPSS